MRHAPGSAGPFGHLSSTDGSAPGLFGFTYFTAAGFFDPSNHFQTENALAMPAGQSCQSVRAELNRLDSRGTQSKVEASTRGAKLAPAQQAEVDRYNQLLNLYLGARCHV